jgi:uncharacterized membrane protein
MRARVVAALRARRESFDALWGTRAGRAAVVAVGLLALLTVAGLAALWPRDEVPVSAGVGRDAERAEVLAVTEAGCRPDVSSGCRVLRIRLRSGEQDGQIRTAVFAGDALSAPVEVGARIRVVPNVPPGEAETAARVPTAAQPWVFLDYDRRAPLLVLVLAFAVIIVVLGRRRGALALVGLAASLFLLVRFVVPAILEGRPPVLVAIVGALAVLLVTLALAHGLSAVTVAAALGAAATLAATALLALLLVDAAQLTGFVSDQAVLLRALSGGAVSPQGLLLAGVVIGALGVLDDVTVSQASTVMALRRAAPARRARELYAEALTVGRDHLAATVNTLALAYAGAALPVLLVFTTTGTSLTEAANREIVAQELVALLVGSIGIAAAVPLTTAVAVALVRRLPAEALGGGHAHAH